MCEKYSSSWSYMVRFPIVLPHTRRSEFKVRLLLMARARSSALVRSSNSIDPVRVGVLMGPQARPVWSGVNPDWDPVQVGSGSGSTARGRDCSDTDAGSNDLWLWLAGPGDVDSDEDPSNHLSLCWGRGRRGLIHTHSSTVVRSVSRCEMVVIRSCHALSIILTHSQKMP